MKSIQAQCVLGTGLSSKGIGWADGSNLSHVDIVLPDGRLLGARNDAIKMPSGVVVPAGVEIREPFYEVWKRRIVFTKLVEDHIAELYYATAEQQLHKPYDSTAIWGFVADRDWRNPDAWFCSELWTFCAETSTTLPKLWTPKNKVMPGHASVAMSANGWTAA
jgi:hypothetical protein